MHNTYNDVFPHVTPDPCDPDKNPLHGCLAHIIAFLLALLICALLELSLGSCTSTRTVSSTIDQHSVETLMQRMDSVIAKRTVVKQDSAWHELILRQFQSLQERNDTSHTLVTDTAGRVIKETLIIRQERATTSETDRHEREVLLHRLSVMDSTLAVMQQDISHTDSLLQQKNETEIKEVPAPLSWHQHLRLLLGNILLIALLVAAGYGAFRLWRRFHPF